MCSYIVPGFWEWIDRMAAAGVVYSIRAFYDEITDGNDELSRWAKDRRDSGLFVAPSIEVQREFKRTADYVDGAYDPGGADPRVVAQAAVDKASVVTRETLAGAGAKRVKIPNLCQHFGVSYLDTYAMLRTEGAKFR
jgi:hypothetical protein